MDVAALIVDAAAEQHKKDLQESKCTVEMVVHNAHEGYAVDVAPLDQKAVMVQFRTLKYKVDRDNRAAFEEIIEFLGDCIERDWENCRNGPDGDLWRDPVQWYTLNMRRQEQQVVQWEFSKDRIKQELKRAMSTLRMIV